MALNLIQTANQYQNDLSQISSNVRENLTTLAEQYNIKQEALVESVMSLIANLRTKVQDNQPIDLMHTNSVAALLAGLDTIAQKLPQATDQQKKANTLRVLAAAGLGSDGFINDAVVPIVELGARNTPLHDKYKNLVNQYVVAQQSGGSVDGTDLLKALGQLQVNLDRAMRTATSSTPPRIPPITATPNAA